MVRARAGAVQALGGARGCPSDGGGGVGLPLGNLAILYHSMWYAAAIFGSSSGLGGDGQASPSVEPLPIGITAYGAQLVECRACRQGTETLRKVLSITCSDCPPQDYSHGGLALVELQCGSSSAETAGTRIAMLILESVSLQRHVHDLALAATVRALFPFA